jgi:hypothetical protein
MEMIKCRVINYFDVWGNEEEGWEINNQCHEMDIEIPADATNKQVFEALQECGFIREDVDFKQVEFEDAYMSVWMMNEAENHRPVCCVEPYFS